MMVMMSKFGRKNRLYEQYDSLISCLSADERQRRNSNVVGTRMLRRSLHIVCAVLAIAVLFGLVVIVQNYRNNLLSTLMLQRVLLFSLMTHGIVFLAILHKQKQFVHVDVFDAVHSTMLEQEQIDLEKYLGFQGLYYANILKH